jgi:hypothetical protein
MPKFLVETISMFRMRYVIEANNVEHAKDEVVMKAGELHELREFSQLHLDEMITSAREIDQAEYLRQFDEDNEYLKDWTDEDKLSFVNIIDYSTNPVLKEIDPSQRDWEYDGCGVKVWKGTMERYDK